MPLIPPSSEPEKLGYLTRFRQAVVSGVWEGAVMNLARFGTMGHDNGWGTLNIERRTLNAEGCLPRTGWHGLALLEGGEMGNGKHPTPNKRHPMGWQQ